MKSRLPLGVTMPDNAPRVYPQDRRVQIIGDATPSVPESFQRRLQQFDKDLLVAWHKSPYTRDNGRWKIEQCVEHHGNFDSSGRPLHSHLCRRIYVMMCQDDEGTPKPLGEWVFEKLGAMRANSESYGGETERGLKNFVRASNNIDEELAAKRQSATEETMAYNRKFNRVQFNKLIHLVEQHDVRPN